MKYLFIIFALIIFAFPSFVYSQVSQTCNTSINTAIPYYNDLGQGLQIYNAATTCTDAAGNKGYDCPIGQNLAFNQTQGQTKDLRYLVCVSKKNDNSVNLKDQFAFGGINSLGEGSSYLIGPMFQVAAIGVTFYLLFGAFKYIASGGDKNAVASARAMITHGFIGLILLLLLFLVVQFIPQFFNLNVKFIESNLPR